MIRTRVIHGSRWKPLLISVTGLLVVWLAIRGIDVQGPNSVVWFLGAIGVVLAVMGALWTLRPSALTLTSEGFEFRDALGRRFDARWSWISSFELFGRSGRFKRYRRVAWRLRPGAPRIRFSRINLNLFDIDGVLPGHWSMASEDLLETMRTWHSAATMPHPGNGPV